MFPSSPALKQRVGLLKGWVGPGPDVPLPDAWVLVQRSPHPQEPLFLEVEDQPEDTVWWAQPTLWVLLGGRGRLSPEGPQAPGLRHFKVTIIYGL